MLLAILIDNGIRLSEIKKGGFVAGLIHSFILAISIAPLQVLYYSRLQHGYCIGVSRRSAQATVGKGLAQGPYIAARAGVEPTTLRLKAIDSTMSHAEYNKISLTH